MCIYEKKRIDGGKYAGFCQIRCCFLYMSLFPFAMSRLSLFHYNFGRIPCFQSILFQSHRSNAFQISQCYLNFEAIFHKKNWPFSVDITRCVFICDAFIFFFSFRSYRDGKIGIFRSLSLEKMGFRQTLQCYCSTVIHCPNDMRYKSKLKSNSPNARKGCKTTAKKRFMGLIHKNIHLYIYLQVD